MMVLRSRTIVASSSRSLTMMSMIRHKKRPRSLMGRLVQLPSGAAPLRGQSSNTTAASSSSSSTTTTTGAEETAASRPRPSLSLLLRNSIASSSSLNTKQEEDEGEQTTAIQHGVEDDDSMTDMAAELQQEEDYGGSSDGGPAIIDATTTGRLAPERFYHRPQYGAGRVPSLVGSKVAKSKLKHMQDLVDRLDDDNNGNESQYSPIELRTAYLYWLSYDVRHHVLPPNSPLPVQNALRIVNYARRRLEKDRENYAGTFCDIFGNGADHAHPDNRHASSIASPNLALVRLIGILLQPLQGTHAAMRTNSRAGGTTQGVGAGRRNDTTNNANVQQILNYLVEATKLADFIQALHDGRYDDPRYQFLCVSSHFRPDALFYQTRLNLIAKRCKFLTFVLGRPPYDVRGKFAPRLRRGISWTDDATVTALAHCQRAQDCVDMARKVLDEMQQNGIDMDVTHHSIFVTILADASRHDDGMADAAFLYVQDQFYHNIINTNHDINKQERVYSHIKKHIPAYLAPSVSPPPLKPRPSSQLPTAVYNPVLLAHCREAERHYKKNHHEKVHALCAQAERIAALLLDNNTFDPITYSLMLKLYKDTHQPLMAQQLLDRMYAQDNALCRPTVLHCNAVLDGYAKVGDADAAVRLLRRMGDAADAVSYTTVASALLRRADQTMDWPVLEAVLRLIEDQQQQQQQQQEPIESSSASSSSSSSLSAAATAKHRSRPDVVTYNVMFDNLYRRLTMAATVEEKERLATLTEQLLWHVIKKSSVFRDVVPMDHWYKFYNHTLRSWTASGAASAVPRSLRLLDEMREAGLRPNGTTYQCILVGASGKGMIVLATDLFQQMEGEGVPRTATSVFAFIRLLLDHVHCNIAEKGIESLSEFVSNHLMERIQASVQLEDCFTVPWVFQGLNVNLAKENDQHRRVTIARLTESTLQWFQRKNVPVPAPELTRCYNACLQAWAFALAPESAKHAIRILDEMKEKSIEPDEKTFEYALTCLSRSPDKASVSTAREIFQIMNDRDIRVTLSMLNIFLRLLVRSNSAGSNAEARKLLIEMESKHQADKSFVPPNRTSYEILWRYCILSKDCIGASEILSEMSKLGRPDTEPSVEMYLETIEAWSGSDREESMAKATSLFADLAAMVKPTSEMYLVLQLAWCHGNRDDAAEQVERILVHMQRDYDSGANKFCRPNLNNFRAVILSLARSGQAEKAEKVLVHLEQLSSDRKDLAPNVGCYEDVMNGWLNSTDLNASARAMSLLQRMRAGVGVLPNQQCYTHAINTLKRSININTPNLAYGLLREMIELAVSGRNRSAQPIHETFSAVLEVCASCFDDKVAIKAANDAVRDYIRLHWPSPRRDLYVKYLQVAYMLTDTQIRDDQVLSVFTDPDFPCPEAVLRAPMIRNGLKQCLTLEGRKKLVDHLGIPIFHGDDELIVSLRETIE